MPKIKSFLLPFLAAFVFSFAFISLLSGGQTSGKVFSGVDGRLSNSDFQVQGSTVVSIPKPTLKIAEPFLEGSVSARSVLITELDSKIAVFAKASDLVLEPASTTKLATALVAVNMWPVDRSLIVPGTCVGLPGDNMGLVSGEVISLKNLLYGMLLNSASDAICVIYSNDGGLSNFTAKMNELAASLDLNSTYFGNPYGFDSVQGGWQGNKSSVSDLSILASEVLKDPILKEIVSTKNVTVTSTDSVLTHQLKNTNELLGVIPGVYGVKTGTTNNAGQCLITALNYNDRNFLIVILGSSDRYADTRKLINWLESSVSW